MTTKKLSLIFCTMLTLNALLYGCTKNEVVATNTNTSSEPNIIKYDPPEDSSSKTSAATNSSSISNKNSSSNIKNSTNNAQSPADKNSSASAVKSVTSSKSSNLNANNASQVNVSTESALYDAIKKGIETGTDISVDLSKISINGSLVDFALKVASETGYAGYLENVQYNTTGNNVVLHFNYKAGKDGFTSQINTVNSQVQQIVASVIKQGMNDYQKELALHNYVVNNTVYDYKNLELNSLPNDSFTAYGVFIKKVAVCQGYSEAMYRLLNAAGVNNKIITGTANGVPHAWNLVSINGAYYHLDSTFDDPISQSGNLLSYNYFNVTDAQISRDHSWTKGNYPACNNTAANYFKVSNLLANNQNDFYNIIYNGLTKKQTTIMCKTSSYDTNTFSPNALVDVISKHPELNYINNSKGFSYSYDQNSSVMEFFVSYK
ncbi:transglutaminase domain-containing protein [Clostridium folliculivorans]|uniref:Transglutaminase-like domain-containing protein n=1 Tax=Clostridium folliculivorans TaxID=2886038 RepID=A0A9W5Y473_9CLOT|nr:transglutaminase domain-containing protein [Clostridium folliculivorans]GKU26336.1 hypothetical protein CFOLD11_31630 [Clostridium folliculivorans]GKU32109.1 hypothetical protein CFB3_42170 [Clostridium folliculivorans]